MSQIELSYKTRDVEEFLDVYFYRPFGFLIAKACWRLGIKPNAITTMGMVIGVAGGHLLFYNNHWLNLYGILLIILNEAFDSADGQLARLSGIHSRYGRIFDGFAGNTVFLSIYIHLCLRYIYSGGSWWVFLLAVISGICHSYQSAMADYYRNGYLHFVVSVKKGELDKHKEVLRRFRSLSWKKDFPGKFLLMFYVNYTRQQESLSGNFQKLFSRSAEVFQDSIPEGFKNTYKEYNKPLLKYYNILTTNTRQIWLFIVVLLDKPIFYFFFELTLLNILLAWVTIKQEHLNKKLLLRLEDFRSAKIRVEK
ncbi:MAG: CDP-alcohol phosphatidyltransferase family protein [Ignavibacteria bacterium]|jgi:phosphatidylglycerophosphate synthase|nr:CDP-alcohol phosphatidyltransferase family protein [Ignavibacteria bacterium]MCU7503896.1 CDP-alcohol phosphatidyltransferase family protein [Ignavibacteria bacterium]MCU7515883.1 CDP-alcohol phosphatidyltransferase family protein [Ignavibacteria bacterium]